MLRLINLLPAACLLLLAVCVAFTSATETSISVENPAVIGGNAVQYRFHVVPSSEGTKVTVKSMKHSSGDVVITNKELMAKGSDFVLDLTKEQAKFGLYKLQLLVEPKSGSPFNKNIVTKVMSPVKVTYAKILGSKLEFGNKLTSTEKLNSASNDKFKVAVEVVSTIDNSPVVPNQAFLQFEHVEKKSHAFFALKPDGKQLKAAVTLSQEAKEFDFNSGKYAVRLVLGDSAFVKSINWDLGTVEVQIGARPIVPPSPLYKKALLHESDTTLKPLPEIEHVMRTQDPRPPAIVSYVFTVLTLAPFAIFIFTLAYRGANLSRFPCNSSAVWDLIFFGSFAAILGLQFVYWLQLTMKMTLQYMLVPILLAGFSGQRVLKRSASTAPVKTKSD